MKKISYIFALLFTASTIFTSCGILEALLEPIYVAEQPNYMPAVHLPDVIPVVPEGGGTTTIVTPDGTVITITPPSNQINPVTDVGVMIGGTIWATRNLDYPGTFAPFPHSAGRLYQWGTLNGVTHHWAATGAVRDWNNNSRNRFAWTRFNDPCPPGWRVPTREEMTTLRNQPNTWVSNWYGTGANGRLFGVAPHQIFLPAVGWRNHSDGVTPAHTFGVFGQYWTNSQGLFQSTRALYFSGNITQNSSAGNPASGFSIRCVAIN